MGGCAESSTAYADYTEQQSGNVWILNLRNLWMKLQAGMTRMKTKMTKHFAPPEQV